MLRTLFNFFAVISFYAVFAEPDYIPEYIPCERGWYYWDKDCYKAGGRKQHERVTWERALERCRSYGGDLASIASQAEQDFIVTFLLLDLKAWTWIGLNDLAVETDYKWTDGTAFNYSNWKPGQPKPEFVGTPFAEDCVHLWFEPENDFTGYWNDLHCHAEERYICEKKSDPRKKSPNPMFCSSEAGSGMKWEESCYYAVSEKKTWQKAEKYCKDYYNGHLVSILDSSEDLFLDYLLSNVTEKIWIGIKVQEQLQQKWTSGWYVSYDGFKKETHYREGTCVARKKRKEWKTIPCTEELSYICKVPKDMPPVLESAAIGSHCPTHFDGWRDLGGEHCYHFETEKVANFYEALFDCKRKGGNMVSLHSKEEADVILPFIKYSRLGRSFYIGLIRGWPRAEEFVWTDGSAVNYENWSVNQPDNELEKCVEVFTSDIGSLYTWNDISCEEKRGYICSVKKISPNSRENDDCTSFCISKTTHLHELVNQSPDAKRLS